ncbi:cytochrome P450 [Iodidimonas sp. SYSU 1G8]|uniref:cytochrome P450 n=1 Tax=Iodidimonas sp. SYSU 1G8 TaxID=3133967 RepID=UPI0031FE7B3D
MTDLSERLPVDAYSLMDPAVRECPYPFYAAMRRDCPVYRMPETGFYVISRYRDLQTVLKDTVTFSNNSAAARDRSLGRINPTIDEMYRTRGWVTVPTLQRTDPPLHGRYRRPIDRTFTASRVREMTPYIDGIVADLVDKLLDEGRAGATVDFVTSFAVPLPCLVIADQFGLPREDVGKLKLWSDALMDSFGMLMTPEREQEVARLILEAQTYFAAAFEERRTRPRGDMLSDLVAVPEGAEPLSMNELLDMMMQLLTGGNDTTTGAIAEGLLLLLRHPEQQDALRRDPSLVRNFVEEVLRVESPVQGLLRVATRTVELGGTVIPEGAVVIARYASANRDEEKFLDGERFDVMRTNSGAHLAFGAGAHFCPGAMLGRQEMTSAFTQLLERLYDIQLAVADDTLEHHPSLLHRRLKSLPVRFRPR